MTQQFGTSNRISVFMDSQSDSQVIRRRKGPAFEYLVPLIYAPALPLIRIALRHKPVLRDRLFYGVLAGAFAHGTYLLTDLYDAESK